ncbi:TetR/AcrR family transcriptional regulator [Streptomyces sp. NPDC127084]|uniref:TetR/AcrR family transcriptional regulator n=1 Tax=Streptomyces sp. NPDC127084 TaxID=3347133 RepID=UPI003651E0C8
MPDKPKAGKKAASGPSTGPVTKSAEKSATPKEAGEPAAPEAAEQHARSTADSTQPRRRQARGERRIAQLLKAASEVFCRNGYTAASTNAIAREAGVSPGTLYQFFPNKEAIAVELGGQLLHRWRDSYGTVFEELDTTLPPERLLDSFLDPLIAFNCENPAFTVLMHGSEIPGRITEEHDAVHSALLVRVEQILGELHPSSPQDVLHRTANMAFAVVKSGLELILAHEGAERDGYITELKNLLLRYLTPLLEAEALAATQRPDAPG